MRRLKPVCYLGTVCSVAALSGCSDAVGPDPGWERQIGVIDIGGFQSPPIELPQTVEVGVPFTATVMTFGSSSCVREDGAEVFTSGLTAHVRPYDLIAVAVDRVCTDDLGPHPREVTIRFDQAGEATVLVLGKTQQGASTQYEARVQVVSPLAFGLQPVGSAPAEATGRPTDGSDSIWREGEPPLGAHPAIQGPPTSGSTRNG
jgi:hypothetical protein